MNENSQIIPLNDICFIELPENWTFQHETKFNAANPDKTIRLTISCNMKKNVADAEAEFKALTDKWFLTFDKQYKPASEIMAQDNLIGKFYNTGNAIEFHALTYIRPMLTDFGIVTFIFRSTRNLDNADIATFEAISKSLVYKVSDMPQ